MQYLGPKDIALEGAWIQTQGGVKADEVCERIEWLIKNSLELVQASDWEAIYKDPRDGRHWLLYYPKSELHGGGPPSMRLVCSAELQERKIAPKHT